MTGLSCKLPAGYQHLVHLPKQDDGSLKLLFWHVSVVLADWTDSTCTCRGACDIVERAFNYAWMQAGFSLENAGQQPGDVLRVRIVVLLYVLCHP